MDFIKIMLPNYRTAITQISGMIWGGSAEARMGQKPRTDYLNLLRYLGNPHEYPCKFVHVAGTNGKGTVCLKLSRLLQSSGMRTGLYTSPHLFSFTERICLDSAPITQEKFSELFRDINYIMKRYDLKVNFFEFLTAMAFVHFHSEKCDVVVLEAGLGGRYDSTNVVRPIVSVITSIGYDHTDTLGNTLDEIAFQKAGIIKEKVPAVLGPECGPLAVFEKEAEEKKSPLFKVQKVDNEEFASNSDRIVEEVARVLQQTYPKMFKDKLTEESLKASKDVSQRCRMEVIEAGKFPHQFSNSHVRRVIFDVGHNPSALAHLVRSLRKKYPGGKFIFVYGASAVKDSLSSIKELVPAAQKIYLVQAEHLRAMPINTLKDSCGSVTPKPEVIEQGRISSTLDYIIKNEEVENVVVCGSFFIMEEAMGFFNEDYIKWSEKSTPDLVETKHNH